MSMMVSFVLSFFPRDVLDEILNLIESVSEDFPSYSYRFENICSRSGLSYLLQQLEKQIPIPHQKSILLQMVKP